MKRAIVGLGVALALFAAWASGLAAELADPAAIRRLVEDAGILAPVVFVLITTACFFVFLLIPPVWASAGLWPLPVAFALSFAACMLGSVVTYVVARRLGSEWAERRIPDGIRRHRRRLEARPITAIVILRLLLWANPFADLLIAITRIPLPTYLAGSAIGLALPTAVHVLLGSGGIAALRVLPPWGVVAVAVAIAAAIAGYVRLRRRRAGEAVASLAEEAR